MTPRVTLGTPTPLPSNSRGMSEKNLSRPSISTNGFSGASSTIESTIESTMEPISEQERLDIAQETARWLFEIGAISFSIDPYFTLTSGKKSPVYVDCRRIISYPRFASFVTEKACRLLAHKQFDAIAGGETGGIPFAAWIAARLNKPMVYVRKQAKGFGLGTRIEGVLEPLNEEQRGSQSGKQGNKPCVLLVEDHATDGASKISFVEALRPFSTIEDAFVVFYYDIFSEGAKVLREKNITLHALTTWRSAYRLAEEEGSYGAKTLEEVSAFLENPSRWQELHL